MPSEPKPSADVPSSKRSLPEEQALLAKAALAATARRLRHDLGRTVSPAVWARRHPWLTVGATMLTGFAAGAVAAKPPRLDAEARAKIKANVARGRRILASVIGAVAPAVRMGRAAARQFVGSANGYHAYDFGDGAGNGEH